MIYTQTDLQNLGLRLKCCAADLATQALKAEKYQHDDLQCKLNKLYYLNKAVCIISDYVPPGTLLEAGIVADSTIDLSGFSSFGNIVGDIRVEGEVIGVIPEDSYPDLDSLITAIVESINANSDYSAVDNGDGTITISAIGLGTTANGFEILIQLNPLFQKETELLLTNRGQAGARQSLHIYNPDSPLHNFILSATRSNTPTFFIEVIDSNKTVDTEIIVPNTVGAYALGYDDVQDKFYTTAFQGGGAGGFNINEYSNTLANTQVINVTGTSTSGSGWATYHSGNGCMYFATAAGNKVLKRAVDGTITQISGITNPTRMIYDPVNDTIWAIGTNALYIINGTTNAVTTISTPGEIPTDITYYPGDGTSNTERMFVTFSTPGIVRSYELDGTVDVSTFYNGLSGNITIIYSLLYNVLFVAGTTVTHVIRLDGSLKNIISEGVSFQFIEDLIERYIIGIDVVISSTPVTRYKYFNLATDGEDQFTASFENATPDVLQTAEDNCLTEDQIEQIIEIAKGICCDCCQTDLELTQDNG